MDQIDNSETEILDSIGYTNIRFYMGLKRHSDTELGDLLNDGGWESWEDPSNQEKLAEFSAVCFLYAREITQRIGNKVKQNSQHRISNLSLTSFQPFGLIGSYWGGTRVEAWSPPEALSECNIGPSDPTEYEKHQNSALYNAMVHPYMKMGIKAVLWYQGKFCETQFFLEGFLNGVFQVKTMPGSTEMSTSAHSLQ